MLSDKFNFIQKKGENTKELKGYFTSSFKLGFYRVLIIIKLKKSYQNKYFKYNGHEEKQRSLFN